MFESSAGLMTPATRQKAGTSPTLGPPCGVKGPAGTAAALLMVVAGSVSLARSSHVAPEAAAAAINAHGARDKMGNRIRSQIVPHREARRLGLECQSGFSGGTFVDQLNRMDALGLATEF